MTRMPPRHASRQGSPQPSIIPTRQTRYVAAQLIAALADEGGYDATLRLVPQLDPDQWPALVAVLLSTGRVGGRPPMRATKYNADERRKGHSLYVQGHRTAWVIEAEREYQRLHKRSRRAANLSSGASA